MLGAMLVADDGIILAVGVMVVMPDGIMAAGIMLGDMPAGLLVVTPPAEQHTSSKKLVKAWQATVLLKYPRTAAPWPHVKVKSPNKATVKFSDESVTDPPAVQALHELGGVEPLHPHNAPKSR